MTHEASNRSELSLRRTRLTVASALLAVLLPAAHASAQTIDVTVFAGRAFPTYDERVSLRPPSLLLPGVDVTVAGNPILSADGGPVLGAAVALEPAKFRRIFGGTLGIEGRLDATDVGLEFTGARYDFRGTAFPFEGLTAGIIVSPGRFDARRIALLSLNGRIRTEGRVGVVASGGLSYLPSIDITGSIPLLVDAPDLGPLPEVDAALTLRAAPGQSGRRFGVNAGAGVRTRGRVALTAEVRGFYFPEFELRLSRAAGPDLLDTLLDSASPIRFSPVFVNAQVGVAFRF